MSAQVKFVYAQQWAINWHSSTVNAMSAVNQIDQLSASIVRMNRYGGFTVNNEISFFLIYYACE